MDFLYYLTCITKLLTYFFLLTSGVYLLRDKNRRVYDILGFALIIQATHHIANVLATIYRCPPRIVENLNAVYYFFACVVWLLVVWMLRSGYIASKRFYKSHSSAFTTTGIDDDYPTKRYY